MLVVSAVRTDEKECFIDEFELPKPMSTELLWLIDKHMSASPKSEKRLGLFNTFLFFC